MEFTTRTFAEQHRETRRGTPIPQRKALIHFSRSHKLAVNVLLIDDDVEGAADAADVEKL